MFPLVLGEVDDVEHQELVVKLSQNSIGDNQSVFSGGPFHHLDEKDAFCDSILGRRYLPDKLFPLVRKVFEVVCDSVQYMIELVLAR